MNNTQQLRIIELFSQLADKHLDKLAEISAPRRFAKGEILFSEGDPATGFYVILKGRIKVYKLSLDGKEQVLHLFGGGEIVGEVPVFAGGRYPAHAEALEASEGLFISRDDFLQLIQSEPTLALSMLAILSKRLRRFTYLIEDLSLKEVPGRLAAYLLMASERRDGIDTIHLDISKGQLASVLGTIPETLSRILTRMAQRQLIRVDGRAITLLDRAGLGALAEGERL